MHFFQSEIHLIAGGPWCITQLNILLAQFSVLGAFHLLSFFGSITRGLEIILKFFFSIDNSLRQLNIIV